MDYSFKPCHFTDNLHDLPKEAIGKLLKFSGDDSVAVKRHLNMFTCVMILYCRFPQYNNEDFKMRLFVRSLEGDALNWFNNFPNDFFTSLHENVIQRTKYSACHDCGLYVLVAGVYITIVSKA